MKFKKKKKKKLGLRVHHSPEGQAHVMQPGMAQTPTAAPMQLNPAILQMLQSGQISPEQFQALMAQHNQPTMPPQPAPATAPVAQATPQVQPQSVEQHIGLPTQPMPSASWPETATQFPTQQSAPLPELQIDKAQQNEKAENLRKMIEAEKKMLFTIIVMPPSDYDSLVVKNSTLDDIQKEFMAYVNSLPKDFPWQETMCILTEASAIWPVSQYPLVFAKSPKTGELYALTKFKMEPEFSSEGYLGASSLQLTEDEEEEEMTDDEDAGASSLEGLLEAAEDVADTEGIEFPDEMYSNEPDMDG